MAAMGNDSFVVEGMAPPQRILFPPEKIYMDWQQRRRAGAGLHNSGNMCFINAVLQCLTYTPPLANYLLSLEHSRSCRQPSVCMMCRMEKHVNSVLRFSGGAIYPSAVVSILTLIGEHFQLGRQEDAHEFLRYAIDAMQRACLGGISNLDVPSQSTTIVHQIFGGFLRSRVTCSSCKAVSDSYEAFLDIPLDIKAASTVTAALTDFVEPEQLDGENCFKCSQCNKMVAASKRFTIHRAPKVLTVCLKRFEDFSGRKINKVVKYSNCLDLRPYMSQTDGEPLFYSLYAVLVHSGNTCHSGHYFCYTKASNGLWYEMDDSSVDLCDSNTVLQQQAYLLFYVRSSDLRGGRPSSPQMIPSHAHAFLSQWAAGSKKVDPVGPPALLPRTKDVAVGTDDAPEDCSSSTRTRTSQLNQADARDASAAWAGRRSTASCASRTRPGFPFRCQRFDRGPHAARRDDEEEDGFTSCSCCQRNGARERAWSNLPQRDKDFRSCLVATEDYNSSARRGTSPSHEQAPRDDSAPWTSSSRWAPASRAPWEQRLLQEREQSQSLRCGCKLCRGFMGYTDDRGSARRRRTSPPSREQTPKDDSPPWTSNSSSRWAPASRAACEQRLLRERERSRSPLQGYNLCTRFVENTDDRGSARRRRTSPPSHEQAPRIDPAPWTSSSRWAPASQADWEQRLLEEIEQSQSLRCGCKLCRGLMENTDDRGSATRRRTSPPSREQTPRDDSPPWTSSSRWARTSRADWEQRFLRERERSRSPLQGYNLCTRFVENTDDHSSARRRRTSPPSREQTPRDDSPPWTSSSRWAPASRADWEQRLLQERERSRSPQCGCKLCSQFVENTEDHGSARRRRTSPPSHEETPRDDSPPLTSNSSSKPVPASQAASEQTQLREKERSRSPRRGYNLRSRFVEYKDYRGSARGGRRARRSPPRREQVPRDDAAPGPSSARSKQAPAPRAAQAQILPRQSERSRSPRQGYDLRSRFVDATNYDPSAGRRRASLMREKHVV